MGEAASCRAGRAGSLGEVSSPPVLALLAMTDEHQTFSQREKVAAEPPDEGLLS